ncbi:cohesin loading factor-domain-containing protein [Xylogone sp. PMI_703]|nr:cohesin loading factor-domain-containing protein [Xylogone sp. PMI_703]
MSYQGGPPPGTGTENGYWAGNYHPNAYGSYANPPHFVPNGTPQVPLQYGHPSALPQVAQPWKHQPIQYQPLLPGNYSPATLYPPAPPQYQIQQPQYSHSVQPPSIQPYQQQLQHPPPPSPSPLPQTYNPMPQHVNPQHITRPPPETTLQTPSAAREPTEPPLDYPMILISLAEEYFDAAHDIGASVALSMEQGDIEEYQKLIATGLGCLETVLKNFRLAPRLEAKVRLRYAGILHEETDNYMEAEMALSNGVALCERNHLHDLKYAMQFLLSQIMFRKNPKASMKALDGYITDAQAYHHYSWVYVFRFLRASQGLECNNATDTHNSVQHLRNLASVASQQGDHAIYVMASLFEALAHMRSGGAEAIENTQHAIGAALTYQLDPDCRIPQLLGLTHILDVACSIQQNQPGQMLRKLRTMQTTMDMKDESWSQTSDLLSIPITYSQKNIQIVSHDTRMVLDAREDGRDVLQFSFLSKNDAYFVTYLLSGIALLHNNSIDGKAVKYLKELWVKLAASTQNLRALSGPLPEFVTQLNWRGQVWCYYTIYIAFCAAAKADWVSLRKSLDDIKNGPKKLDISLTGSVGLFVTYLTGVYYQGIGNLERALKIFEGAEFVLPQADTSPLRSIDKVEHYLAILAALNVVWILQERGRQDTDNNAALLARLELLCANHPSQDIRTAYNIVMATVNTNPPAQLFKLKTYLSAALNGAKSTANTQLLCITLSVMCNRFFTNVVGEQAEKSALAATLHAQKSGSTLWMSVADGMLAQCYDVQGKKAEAHSRYQEALRYAQESALPE